MPIIRDMYAHYKRYVGDLCIHVCICKCVLFVMGVYCILRVQKAKAQSELINQLSQENRQLAADMREVKGNQKVRVCVHVCAYLYVCVCV